MPDLPQPPQSVKRAIGCIWISFGITVLSWISLFFMDPPEYLKQLTAQTHTSIHTFLIIKLGALAVTGCIIYWVLSKLALGRDWARIVCLIAGLIALPDSLFRFFGYQDVMGKIESFAWNAPYLGFGYYALYLLYTSPGKDWFKQKQSG